jgi:hypothetical protein
MKNNPPVSLSHRMEPVPAGALVQTASPSPPPEVTESDRFRLARVARDAALSVPGVVATDPGRTGMFVTLDGAGRVEGVICVAAPEGGYDLSLRLMCAFVSLPALGEAVKAAVRAAAAGSGLAAATVSVHIAEIVGPGAF